MRTQPTRGAVAVEAALVLPILALLLFGLVELGLAWRSSNRLATSTHVASLSLSRDVEDRHADYDALSLVASSVGGSLDNVTAVVIYRTSDIDGQVPGPCAAIADTIVTDSSGVPGVCNVYAGAFLATLTPTAFTATNCIDEPDAAFCPTTRRSMFGPGDRIGVEVRLRHDWVTSYFPAGAGDMADRGVAAIEPATGF